MRTNRRGSVTVEAAMVIPIVVVMILLGRYVLEASVSRQETAVFARGSAINAATGLAPLSCEFERDQFNDHAEVNQTAVVTCRRQNSENELNREQPMWDEVEDGAAPWDEILRDVKPARSPNDVIATADVSLSLQRPAFLAQQKPATAGQSYISPDRVLWNHDERGFGEAHDRVIWDEICKKAATYALFPNVFPSGGGPQC